MGETRSLYTQWYGLKRNRTELNEFSVPAPSPLYLDSFDQLAVTDFHETNQAPFLRVSHLIGTVIHVVMGCANVHGAHRRRVRRP